MGKHSGEITEMGERILSLMSGIIRALQLYDVKNDTVQRLFADLAEVINEFDDDAGVISILFDGQNYFLNQELLRLDYQAFQRMSRVNAMMKSLGVNEVEFRPGTTPTTLHRFFTLIAKARENPDLIIELESGDDTNASLQWVEGTARSGQSSDDHEGAALRLFLTLELMAGEYIHLAKTTSAPRTVNIRRVLHRMVDLVHRQVDVVLAVGHYGDHRRGLAGHLARASIITAALAHACQVDRMTISRAALLVFTSQAPLSSLEDGWYDASREETHSAFNSSLTRLLESDDVTRLPTWQFIALHEAQMMATSDQPPYPEDLKSTFALRLAGTAMWYDRLRAGMLGEPGEQPLAPPEAVSKMSAIAYDKTAHISQGVDRDLMWALAKVLGRVPPGSMVKLQNGAYGVVRVRPEVIQVTDTFGKYLDEYRPTEATEGVPLDVPGSFDIGPAIGWQPPSTEA